MLVNLKRPSGRLLLELQHTVLLCSHMSIILIEKLSEEPFPGSLLQKFSHKFINDHESSPQCNLERREKKHYRFKDVLKRSDVIHLLRARLQWGFFFFFCASTVEKIMHSVNYQQSSKQTLLWLVKWSKGELLLLNNNPNYTSRTTEDLL